MNYIVAVSGGVDSVVLLDMVAMGVLLDDEQIVVAHFDHGIRPDSASDALFVKAVAETYGFTYETRREELGPEASEETARVRRYAFLRDVAKRYGATIVTAHHADDVVETIAINLLRGTGWRGVAVLDSPDILRPLLAMRKSEIIGYADHHGLEWREDSTNSDMKYLRNSVRKKLSSLDDETVQLLGLYRNRQAALKHQIDEEAAGLVGKGNYSRYLFISVPGHVARELLRTIIVSMTGVGATRPQLDGAILAIKTFAPAKRHKVNSAVTIRFTKTEFVIEE